MNDIDFIEKYCVIKDSSNKVNKIRLKDYQKKFIMYINKLKLKLNLKEYDRGRSYK